MRVQPERSPTNPNPKDEESKLCSECKLNPYKYKCPGCSLRSCSLPCVKAHKHRTGCTGKRTQQTEFVPISQFDDNLLFSDYNMLEEVKRVAESARRIRSKFGGNYHYGLPYPLKYLHKAARRRSTQLAFLPNGMSKRVTNRSYFNYRKKFISWTIEWRFHSTDAVIVDHGINENRNLRSVIINHLKPGPWTHPLRQFCEEPLDSLRFFIRKYSKGPKSPFRELDITSPLSQLLANLFILEYPVIHVFLPSHSFDFEIAKEVSEKKPAIKESIAVEPPSAKGVIFKEEEIEETNSSDPQVFDQIKKLNPSHVLEENADRSSKLISENFQNTQDNDDMQLGDFDIDAFLAEDLDFDFDPGMIDAYSDLIAQHNPDDFLDLENIFLEETRNCTDSGDVKELEEGEIPAG